VEVSVLLMLWLFWKVSGGFGALTGQPHAGEGGILPV
jgi:hypothetical protein